MNRVSTHAPQKKGEARLAHLSPSFVCLSFGSSLMRLKIRYCPFTGGFTAHPVGILLVPDVFGKPFGQ